MSTLIEEILETFRNEGEAAGLRRILVNAKGMTIQSAGPEMICALDAGQRIIHNARTRSYTFHWPNQTAEFRESPAPLMSWPNAEMVKAYALRWLGHETDPEKWGRLDPAMIDFNAELEPLPKVDAAVEQATAKAGKPAEQLMELLENEAQFAAGEAVAHLSPEDKAETQRMLAEFIKRQEEEEC